MYCRTWRKSLLCDIKKFVIEEFVIRVFHCITYVQIQLCIIILYVHQLHTILSSGYYLFVYYVHGDGWIP